MGYDEPARVMIDWCGGGWPVADEGVRPLDVDRPNSARVYDWFIGGSHNYAIDRAHGQKCLEVLPSVSWACVQNRRWLQRAVRYGAECGIRQFLDLGSGMPTEGPVHEIAQSVSPDARVVYVDNEPVAVAHSEILLDGVSGAGLAPVDLEDPHAVVNHPVTRGLLDFEQPVMVLLAALLHFVPPEHDPERIIAGYRRYLTSGSLLAMSHDSGDEQGEGVEAIQDLYKGATNPFYLRSRPEFTALFAGFDLVEPGVVWTPQWRPDDPASLPARPERAVMLAGVATLP